MNKKKIITIITTIIITIIFIIAKNLIYGTDTVYIANAMPGLGVPSVNLTLLAHKTAINRLFWFIIFNIVFSMIYTIFLFIKNIYTSKKDIFYTLIVFIIPLLICYILIYHQLGYVW